VSAIHYPADPAVRDIFKEDSPMIDHIRRNILATSAAATALAAAPQVFAQQAGQGNTKFYEKGPVRIAYQEVGSGFPLLATPGGGLNSKMSNWANAVINVMAEFKNDFRCITMDQRNVSGIVLVALDVGLHVLGRHAGDENGIEVP
jgi:hypothetical protein